MEGHERPKVADLRSARAWDAREGEVTSAGAAAACGRTRHFLAAATRVTSHGEDLNPKAVELCKVSLWMEAVEPGLPLTFLDSHILQGNALLGTNRRAGVLWTEACGNPWGLQFLRMLDMTNDSGLFRTQAQLEAAGARRLGNRFEWKGEMYLPLAEAKMAHHFNHRYGDYSQA